MAIEDILQALENQAQADIELVLGEAREHSELILAEAQRNAEKARAAYREQVERDARSRAAKMVNAARLDAKMRVSSARGNGIEAVFAQAGTKLASVREKPGYDTLFGELLAEAAGGLSGHLIVHVDPADADRARTAVAASDLDAEVVADLSSAGGVVIEASGGRIQRRNTLEDRLDRARQYVQADVAKALFA